MNSYTVIANWKQNSTIALVNQYRFLKFSKGTLFVCPPLPLISELAQFHTVAAQNVSPYKAGAHTGEVGADLLRQIGVSACLVGHSERRSEWSEDSGVLDEKLIQLISNDIIPVYCFGETKEEKVDGATFMVIDKQLQWLTSNVANGLNELYLAYEPVWSIGTGDVPTTEYIESVISYILRKTDKLSIRVKILYGGSVSESSIPELLKLQTVNGILVGGLSLKPEEFQRTLAIIDASINI